MKLYLEAGTREEQKIKDYLEENASSMLAEKINNGVRIQKDGRTLLNKKTLAGFMKYAAEEAKKLAGKGAHAACVEDDIVYGWAIHYFEENSIEGTLYNEDGSEHKIPPKPAAKAPVVKPAPSKPQLSMFDLMGENRESVSAPSEEKPDDGEDDMSSDEEIQEIMAEISEEEKAEQQRTYLISLSVCDFAGIFIISALAFRHSRSSSSRLPALQGRLSFLRSDRTFCCCM